MKKRIFTIFLVILIAVTNMTVCYAAGVDSLVDINLDNYQEYLASEFSPYNTGDDVPEYVDSSESASGIIKLIINVFTWIPKVLVSAILEFILFIFPSMDDIIFNDEVSIWGRFFRLSYFDAKPPVSIAASMVTLVSTIYQIFRYVALIGFIVAIACIAVKMIVSSIGKQKQQYKEALKNWVVGLVLLVVGHWIMIYAIYFSEWLVKLIVIIKDNCISESWLAEMQGLNFSFDLTSTFSTAVGASAANSWGWTMVFIWAIMAIIAIVVFVAMNMKIVKVYLERVIVVGVLIMIFPLVTVFYAFEKSGIKRGTTFETWLRTFMDQVFIQPVHALTLLGVMAVLVAVSKTPIMAIPIVSMLVVLMVLNTMFTIENVIKRVFAVNGASLGSPVNAMGAVMAGVGMGVPAVRSGISTAREAVKGKKGFGKIRAASKATAKGAVKFLTSDKDAIGRNISTVLGAAGVHVPREVFSSPPMSVSEQKRRRKFARKIAKDNSVMGEGNFIHNDNNEALDTFRALRHQIDNDGFMNILNKLDTTEAKLRGTIGNENATEEDKMKLRIAMVSMGDPDSDIDKLIGNDASGKFDVGSSEIKLQAALMKDSVRTSRATNMVRGGIKNPDDARTVLTGYNNDDSEYFDACRDDVGIDKTALKDFMETGNLDKNKISDEQLRALMASLADPKLDVNTLKDSTGGYSKPKLENLYKKDSDLDIIQARSALESVVNNSRYLDPTAVDSLRAYSQKYTDEYRSALADINSYGYVEDTVDETYIENILNKGNQASGDEQALVKLLVERMLGFSR